MLDMGHDHTHATVLQLMQLSPTPEVLVPGHEITKCILVVVKPLDFWACDWSNLPMEALLRA